MASALVARQKKIEEKARCQYQTFFYILRYYPIEKNRSGGRLTHNSYEQQKKLYNTPEKI